MPDLAVPRLPPNCPSQFPGDSSLPLAPGTRLGPYEIVAPLGAGGMGEVYRARDTRLGREVAIKVLPRHLSANPEVRARFEREAKTVSSLNHPNICTLFDVGRAPGEAGSGDTDYLVMELVDGETLAQRLAKGPLPAAELLRIGGQIADALDRAHRAGVIHRDLKPGNVMLTKSGAKLMDFGLARATGLAGPAGGGAHATLTQSPTVAEPLTAEGTIVGTFQYMSPEQLEGREVDSRSDLWALGCVLYEMATGRRAFEGQSQASLIAAILKEQPRRLSEQAPLAPLAFERLVNQCLAKDPEERWQTAGDLRRELLWIAEPASSSGAPAQAAPPSRRASLERTAWVLAALATVAAVAFALALRSTGSAYPRPVFTSLTYRPLAIYRAAFAPDGRTIVFSAASEGNKPHLFVIRPETPEPQPFGEPGTHLLSVSSRGELAVLTGARWLAHRLLTGTLARMPLGGGAPREILENVRDAAWAPDGSGLAIIREVAGRDRLEYPVGHILHESDGYLSDLRFSPRGDAIAFFEHPTRFDDRGSLNLVDLHGKSAVLSDGYWGEEGIAWSRDGKEVLFSASRSGNAWTVHAITATGRLRTALESAGGLTIHDVNSEGRWLTTRDEQSWSTMIRTPGHPADQDVSWLDASLWPSLSEDGGTVALTEQGRVAGNNYAVGLRRTAGGAVVRLGEGLSMDLSADGRKVLAMISSPPQLVVYPTGPGEPQRLDRGNVENYGLYGQWFPGGDSILFRGNERGKAPRCFVQKIAGGPPRGVTPEGTHEGVLSGDGRFVVARMPDGNCRIFPLAAGEPRPAPGLLADDNLTCTSADERSVFVARASEGVARVERVDLESGRRTFFATIAPPDLAGLLGCFPTEISDDGRTYAYWAWRLRSTLFAVEWTK